MHGYPSHTVLRRRRPSEHIHVGTMRLDYAGERPKELADISMSPATCTSFVYTFKLTHSLVYNQCGMISYAGFKLEVGIHMITIAAKST
jgi:hypothetical protein